MKSPKPKRILWICNHRTHRFEEVNLLMDAGFEVIPIRDNKNDTLGLKWRPKVTLTDEQIITILSGRYDVHPHTLRFFDIEREKREAIKKHIDIIMLASFMPAIADLQWFRGKILFRAFGHGSLNTYTRIFKHSNVKVNIFNARYHWCPISTALSRVEDKRITRGEIVLSGAVSPSRIKQKWFGEDSNKMICEVIPKIKEEPYYTAIYKTFMKNFGDLPTMILGRNKPRGNIAGKLGDRLYYKAMAQSRAMIYHANNPFHLHYHPVEAMFMGVPVLFNKNSLLAFEAVECGIKRGELPKMGMCANNEIIKKQAQRCLDDIEFAMAISEAQRPFTDIVFSQDRALKAAKAIHDL